MNTDSMLLLITVLLALACLYKFLVLNFDLSIGTSVFEEVLYDAPGVGVASLRVAQTGWIRVYLIRQWFAILFNVRLQLPSLADLILYPANLVDNIYMRIDGYSTEEVVAFWLYYVLFGFLFLIPCRFFIQSRWYLSTLHHIFGYFVMYFWLTAAFMASYNFYFNYFATVIAFPAIFLWRLLEDVYDWFYPPPQPFQGPQPFWWWIPFSPPALPFPIYGMFARQQQLPAAALASPFIIHLLNQILLFFLFMSLIVIQVRSFVWWHFHGVDYFVSKTDDFVFYFLPRWTHQFWFRKRLHELSFRQQTVHQWDFRIGVFARRYFIRIVYFFLRVFQAFFLPEPFGRVFPLLSFRLRLINRVTNICDTVIDRVTNFRVFDYCWHYPWQFVRRKARYVFIPDFWWTYRLPMYSRRFWAYENFRRMTLSMEYFQLIPLQIDTGIEPINFQLPELGSIFATQCVNATTSYYGSTYYAYLDHLFVTVYAEELVKYIPAAIYALVSLSLNLGYTTERFMFARLVTAFVFSMFEWYVDKCLSRGLSVWDYTLYPAIIMHWYVSQQWFVVSILMHWIFNLTVIYFWSPKVLIDIAYYNGDSEGAYELFNQIYKSAGMLRGNRSQHFPNSYELSLLISKLHDKKAEMRVVNHHPGKNAGAIAALENGQKFVRLYGYTAMGEFIFKFPSSCSAPMFTNFLDRIRDHPHRRKLCLEGILTNEIYFQFREVFKGLNITMHADVEEKQDIPDENSFKLNDVPIVDSSLFQRILSHSKDIQEICFAIDVLRKIANKDLTGVGLNVGMRTMYLGNLIRMCNVASFDVLVKTIRSFDVSMHGEGDLEDATFGFIPEVVSKSPRIRKLIAFALIVGMSPFVQDLSIVRNVAEKISWPTIEHGMSFMNVTISAITALYGMLCKVMEGNASLEDIVGLPKNVKFIRDAREQLNKDRNSQSEPAMRRDYNVILELLKSRMFLKSDAEICKLKDRLEILAKELLTTILENRVRDEPMFLGLFGKPGAGKSLLQEVLCNMLSEDAGIERFLGDILHYNISLKWAAETGINPEALYFIINDAPQHYTAFPMQDKIPLNDVIQQVIDTAKYDPRAADVKDKGKQMYALTHFIISSNFCKFSGTEDTEKLLRRMGNGLSVWVFLRVNGQEITYDELHPDFEQHRRNDCIRFQRCVPYANGAQFGFNRIGPEMTLQEYLRAVLEATATHKRKLAIRREKFYNADALCACKVPHAMHFTEREGKMHRDIIVPGKCDAPGEMERCVRSMKYDNGPEASRFKHKFYMEPIKERLSLLSERFKTCVHDSYRLGVTSLSELPFPVADEFSLVEYSYGFYAIIMWLLSFGWWFLGFVMQAWFISFFSPRNLRQSFEDLRDAISNPRYLAEALMIWRPMQEVVLCATILVKPANYDIARISLSVTNVCFRIRRFIRRHYVVILAIIAMIAGYSLWKTDSQPAHDHGKAIYAEQVRNDVIFTPSREMRFTVEQQSRWGKPNSTIQTITPKTVGVHFEDMLKRVANNTRRIEIRDSKMDKYGGLCFMWNCEWISVNKHFVDHTYGDEVEVRVYDVLGEQSISVKANKKEFFDAAGTELYFFHNWFDPAVPDCTVYLPIELGTGPFVTYVPHLSKEMDEKGKMGIREMWMNPKTKVVYEGIRVDVWSTHGDCGAPLMAHCPQGWVLCGILAAGTDKADGPIGMSYFTPVDRMVFSNTVSKRPFPEVRLHSIELPDMYRTAELSPKAVYRQFDSPLLRPIGTLIRPQKQFKTKFVRTRNYEDFVNFLEHEYAPPKATSGMHEGEFKASLMHSFKYIDLPDKVTYTQLFECMRHYLDTAVPPSYVKEKNIKLDVLSLGEAMFGRKDISVDRVDFKTSCGPPWTDMGIHNKFELFDQIGEEELEIEGVKGKFPIYSVKQEILDAIERRIQLMTEGVLLSVYVAFTAKDEIRLKEAIDAFKIRDFSVLGFDFNWLARSRLMPIIKFLMAHPEFSECYGEMNAGSKQWTELANRLRKFKYYVDFDFSKFDMRHWRMLRIVAEFFYLAALRLGYGIKEATQVYYIVLTVSVQVLIYNNDVALKFIGMPSGVLFTLILNSIVNSILMRLAFLLLIGSLIRFHESMVPATVGDDNVSGVSEKIIDKFNVITVCNALLDAGYVATPAKKNNAPRAHIPFGELSFLKRRFVWSVELGLFLAPIEKDSIYKSLCWQRSDMNIDGDVRMGDVALTAQREAFLHGREFFAAMQCQLWNSFRKRQMLGMLQLLEFDELIVEIHSGTFRTTMC